MDETSGPDGIALKKPVQYTSSTLLLSYDYYIFLSSLFLNMQNLNIFKSTTLERNDWKRIEIFNQILDL